MGRGGGALPQALRAGHGWKGRRVALMIEEGVALARMTTIIGSLLLVAHFYRSRYDGCRIACGSMVLF